MNVSIHKNNDLLMLLASIFMLYVIGDYLTTMIAIDVSPLGIDGELNPLAVLLYTNYGSISLLLAKLAMFGALASAAIILLKRNNKARFMIKKVLFGFVIFSAIVVGINIYSILTI